MKLGLKGACVALLVGTLATALPVAATVESSRIIDFAVKRDDSQIGHHTVTVREAGNIRYVAIEIDLEISLAFITLFEYRHRNHEVWENGRLVALDSWTNDDGTKYQVTARATDDGLLVTGPDGRFVAPADIVPTSYWNPATIAQRQLLDTQRGQLLDIVVTPSGEEPIIRDGQPVDAQRYRISGDLELDIWYAARDWVKIAFEARGAEIAYALRSPGTDRQGSAGR